MTRILKLFISGFLLILLVVGFLHPTKEISRDLGEHLLIGKIIFETHKIITTNLFSYTYPNYQFIDNKWLGEIIFYIFDKYLGLNSLIILNTFTVVAAFLVVYSYVMRRYNILLISCSSILYLLIIFDRTYIRPEIFSYFFLAAVVVLLYRFREKFTKSIFLIIPIQLMWVNMHIYFILGIFLIALFLVEALISYRTYKIQYSRKYIFTLFVVFVASVIVAFINPYGLRGVLFPFTFYNNYGFPINENLNFFTVAALLQNKFIYSYFAFEVIGIMLIVLLFLNLQKSRLIDWLVSFSFIALVISSVRNMPLFVFATYIPFIHVASLTSKKFHSITQKYRSQRLNYQIILSVFIILLIIGLIINYWSIQGFGFGSDKRGENAVNFLISNNIKGPIFNNYDIGSYLAYRLYPKELVFVDGRPEAYPYSFYSTIYLPMQKNEKIFKEIDNRYFFNSVFINYPDQQPLTITFLKSMIANNDWVPVYLDESIVIFIKNNDANKKIVQKYKISPSTYQIPNESSVLSIGTIGNFFSGIGWKQQAIEAYEKVLSIESSNCEALNNLLLLLDVNNPQVSIYQMKYQFSCQR